MNVEDLKCQRMVMKHRYLLNKDPEIVIDELLNPNNCINYKRFKRNKIFTRDRRKNNKYRFR